MKSLSEVSHRLGVVAAEWANGEEDTSATGLFHPVGTTPVDPLYWRDLRFGHHPLHHRQHAGACVRVDSVAGDPAATCQAMARLVGSLQLRRRVSWRVVLEAPGGSFIPVCTYALHI